MAQRKAANPVPDPIPGLATRGRNNYNALGVLRTKPGRADSAPTISMSCSDKIALWTQVGIQGALGAAVMRPVYLDSIVIGDVPTEMREATLVECRRAFSKRLESVSGKEMELLTGLDRSSFPDV
jgi:tRNA-specific adenosine deaminase 1